MSLSVRDATADECAFADARYREIQFSPTQPSHRQLVAELEGVLVGLGRLVPIAPGVVELSGIWTSDAVRGRGVARAMVTELMVRAADDPEVWCVPFSHLVKFYESFGFAAVPRPWPAPITAKVEACIALAQPVEGALRLVR
jgi:predicted GNAT family N-acyltransferase